MTDAAAPKHVLSEVLERFVDPEQRERAAGELLKAIERQAHLGGDSLAREFEQQRADVVQDLFIGIMQHLDAGERIPNPEAYIWRALANRYKSLYRRRKARGGIHAEWDRNDVNQGGSTLGDPSGGKVIAKELLKQWGALVAATKERMSPRYTQVLERTVEEMLSMALETVTMNDLMEREGLSPEADEAERKRMRDRLLTRHSRARKRLSATLEEQIEGGAISSEDASGLRFMLDRLFRCQRRGPGSVSGAGAGTSREGDS